MKLNVTVNGQLYEIDVEVAEEERAGPGPIIMGGGSGQTNSAPTTASVPAASANSVVATLAGNVSKVLVEEGQEISAGEILMVLEAMKMETEITAPSDGTIGAILVGPGDAVSGGQVLIELAS